MRLEFKGRGNVAGGGRVSKPEEDSLLDQSPGVLRLLPLLPSWLEGGELMDISTVLTIVFGETAESSLSAWLSSSASERCGGASIRTVFSVVCGGC